MSEMMATSDRAGPRMTPKRDAEPDWTSGDVRKLAEAVVEHMQEAAAVLSMDDIEAAERRLASMAELRRAALLILSSPGTQLLEQVERNRDFAIHVARIHHRLSGYPEELRGLSELLECAQARIVVALSTRVDFDQIVAEAGAAGPASPDRPGAPP